MKRILVGLFMIILTVSAFADARNRTDLGRVMREDKVVASAYCYPSGTVVLTINGATVVLDSIRVYQLNSMFNTFLEVVETVEGEDIQVKYQRHISRMWAENSSIWSQVTCNFTGAIDRVVFSGGITRAATYESTRFALTADEVRQIQDLFELAQEQSRRMTTEIAMLNNIIAPE